MRLPRWLRRRNRQLDKSPPWVYRYGTVKISGLNPAKPWDWADEEWAVGWKLTPNDQPRWIEKVAEWTVDTGDGNLGFDHEADALEYVRLANLGGDPVEAPTYRPYERWDGRPSFTCRDRTRPTFMGIADEALRRIYLPALSAAIVGPRP